MENPFEELYTRKDITHEDNLQLCKLQSMLRDIGADGAIIGALEKAIHNARADSLIKLRDAEAEEDYRQRKAVLHYM